MLQGKKVLSKFFHFCLFETFSFCVYERIYIKRDALSIFLSLLVVVGFLECCLNAKRRYHNKYK